MAALRVVLLLFLCRLPLASSCIPTVTPDDMYEDEMEATTSVLLTTVLDMTAETTSQATAEPTTTTSTAEPTTTTSTAEPTTTTSTAEPTTTTSTAEPTTTTSTAEPTTTTSTTTTTTTTTSTTTTTTTTTGMCPPSWVLNPAINFCYLLVPASSGTVDNAKCDAQVAGATLASIHNADENDFIASNLAGATTNYVFMGGYSTTMTLGTWYWTDGTMYGPYENWEMSLGYPRLIANANCMAMSRFPAYLGKWYNAPCDAAYYDLFCMIAAT